MPSMAVSSFVPPGRRDSSHPATALGSACRHPLPNYSHLKTGFHLEGKPSN